MIENLPPYSPANSAYERLVIRRTAQARGEALGRSYAGELDTVLGMVREAVVSDPSTRDGLVRGLALGMGEATFPKRVGKPRVDEARIQFTVGVRKVLNGAIDAMRESREYRPLDIPRFLGQTR